MMRRTEDITYQTSRTIRHTRIPQGVIKRMSLAVLVNQNVRWEGEGAARHRVLVPPAPETLKSIKDLVAGVTGLNAERGDQLIVETLPFESSLNAEPPKSTTVAVPKPVAKGPAWLEFLNKHRDLATPLAVALVLITIVLAGISRFMRKRRVHVEEVSLPDTIGAPPAVPQLPLSGQAAAAASQLEAAALHAKALPEAAGKELTERVRQMVKREPDTTANVVRMWLQDIET